MACTGATLMMVNLSNNDLFTISDTHFGHKNVTEHCPSRCELGDTIEEHDQELIRRWNSVVGPKDRVFHVGDFTLSQSNRYLKGIVEQLNGRITLIRGNHDKYKARQYLEAGFVEVLGVHYIDDTLLTHYPVHALSLAGYHSVNIHGHLHEHYVQYMGMDGPYQDPRYINVSVEQIEFTPIAWNVLVENWDVRLSAIEVMKGSYLKRRR